jgi:hypothetical protein
MSSPADVAGRIMSKSDEDKNGSVSSAEFAAGLQAVPGISMTDNSISKLFGEIDADSDGELKQDELTSYLDKLTDSVRSAMLSAQENASGNDKGAKAQDPLDTNKDGLVSMTERLLGAIQPATSGTGKADETGSVLADMKSALVSRVYQAMTEKTSAALSTASSSAALNASV